MVARALGNGRIPVAQGLGDAVDRRAVVNDKVAMDDPARGGLAGDLLRLPFLDVKLALPVDKRKLFFEQCSDVLELVVGTNRPLSQGKSASVT
jgi:hypothetical protein